MAVIHSIAMIICLYVAGACVCVFMCRYLCVCVCASLRVSWGSIVMKGWQKTMATTKHFSFTLTHRQPLDWFSRSRWFAWLTFLGDVTRAIRVPFHYSEGILLYILFSRFLVLFFAVHAIYIIWHGINSIKNKLFQMFNFHFSFLINSFIQSFL